MGNAAFVIGGGEDDDDDDGHVDELEQAVMHESDHHAIMESEQNQHYHTPQASPQRIARQSSSSAYNNNSNTHTISLNSPSSASHDNSDMWRRFPLHHAAACGAPITELSRIIELSGTDVDDIHDESGSTPLHYAAMYGQETTVRWLLKQRRMLGRNQPVRDFQGRTASDMAKQSGFADLAQVIDFHHQSNSNSSLIISGSSGTSIRPAQHHNDNVLLQELDRANSTIQKLKASEKRVRMELEQEIAERMKLFRSLVKSHDTIPQQQQPAADLVETMSDMRLQMVEFKAQRDALAAELKLVELAVADFELYITGNTSSDSINFATTTTTAAATASPSERLKSCLRRI